MDHLKITSESLSLYSSVAQERQLVEKRPDDVVLNVVCPGTALLFILQRLQKVPKFIPQGLPPLLQLCDVTCSDETRFRHRRVGLIKRQLILVPHRLLSAIEFLDRDWLYADCAMEAIVITKSDPDRD